MHTEIPLSFGMEFPLEVFVLWIIRRPVRDDENRLEETQRGRNIKQLQHEMWGFRIAPCMCLSLSD